MCTKHSRFVGHLWEGRYEQYTEEATGLKVCVTGKKKKAW